MIGSMLKTGGSVALSLGALVTAGTMNLAVLSEGPSGPGHIVLRAAASTTTTAAPQSSRPARLAVAAPTTAAPPSTTTTRTHTPATAATTTTDATTTTTAPKQEPPTTTTTQPPKTRPPVDPHRMRTFVVRDAGTVHVRWTSKRVISATADPNDGWSLPHDFKQGPDVTLRFYSTTQLVVWHAWVEANTIKAWIHVYNL